MTYTHARDRLTSLSKRCYTTTRSSERQKLAHPRASNHGCNVLGRDSGLRKCLVIIGKQYVVKVHVLFVRCNVQTLQDLHLENVDRIGAIDSDCRSPRCTIVARRGEYSLTLVSCLCASRATQDVRPRRAAAREARCDEVEKYPACTVIFLLT